MDAERLFVRYAYSCGQVQRDHLGRITDEELARTRRMADGEERTDITFLPQTFPVAFRRLEEVARATGLDAMSEEALDAYFIIYHNLYIDARDGSYARLPPTICEFCKTHVARVEKMVEATVEERPRRAFVISAYEHAPIRQAGVSAELVPEAKAGDLVVIHQGWAVKKIDERYYLRLKEKYIGTPLHEQLSRGVIPQ